MKLNSDHLQVEIKRKNLKHSADVVRAICEKVWFSCYQLSAAKTMSCVL